MRHKRLTATEEKRLADAFVAQAMAMGLKSNKKLPRDIKLQVRKRILRAIEDERRAKISQNERRQEHEAAENTFTWQPAIRRR